MRPSHPTPMPAMSGAAQRGAVLALLAFSAACSDTATEPIIVTSDLPAAYSDLIAICHYDEDGDQYFELSIALSSEGAHRAHGDGQAGDAVPGMEGFQFDEQCQPVPSGPQVFAIAYTDIDPLDGPGFKDGLDVLISKIVDANGDGVLGGDDQIITDRYPKTFGPYTAADFGSYTMTSFTLSPSNSVRINPGEVTLGTGWGTFQWFSSAAGLGYEAYNEGFSPNYSLWLDWTINPGYQVYDRLVVYSYLHEDSFASRRLSYVDDAFVDVEVLIGGG